MSDKRYMAYTHFRLDEVINAEGVTPVLNARVSFKDTYTTVRLHSIIFRIFRKAKEGDRAPSYFLYTTLSGGYASYNHRDYADISEDEFVTKVLGIDKLPYSVKDIYSMVLCGYTDDEVRNGDCPLYRKELLNIKDINDIVIEDLFNIVVIVSGRYVYRYPNKLVRDYRPELLNATELHNTKYLVKNNFRYEMSDTECAMNRIHYLSHKIRCFTDDEYADRNADYSDFNDFVLKTKIIDKDKNNGWFTVECDVRSEETKDSCSKHMKEIDACAIKAAEKLLTRWDIPIGAFDVGRKWFTTGAVMYRFGLKKELETKPTEKSNVLMSAVLKM